MRAWTHRHREALGVAAASTLVLSIALGGMAFALRRPVPAPILIMPAAPEPSSTPAPVLVHVLGAVACPGVYALSWDSRVEQAIAAAGDATSDADLLSVNLAQRVHDEQQIYVPHQGEQALPVSPAMAAPVSATSSSQATSQKININTASAAELEALPGIGPTLAQRILEYRQTHGPFRTIEDIKDVSGIGDGIFGKVRDGIIVQ